MSRQVLHDGQVEAYRAWVMAYLLRRSAKDEDGCLIWQGACNCANRTGLPIMGVRGAPGRAMLVRRLAAWVGKRSPRSGDVLSTMCGKRLCVLPEHMRPIGRAALMRQLASDGRLPTGPTRSARRLAAARAKAHVHMTIEKARAIRARYAELANAKAVAAEFGIRHDHAHRIIRNQLWREPSPFSI